MTDSSVHLNVLRWLHRRGLSGSTLLTGLFDRCGLRVRLVVRRCSAALTRHPFVIVLALVWARNGKIGFLSRSILLCGRVGGWGSTQSCGWEVLS